MGERRARGAPPRGDASVRKTVTLTCVPLIAAWILGASWAYGREFAVLGVVGDSISWGWNPDVPGQSGWVQMLFGSFGTEKTINALWPAIAKHNGAVSGSTAEEWAGADYAPMKELLAHYPDLVVVYIGGNDLLAQLADGDFSQAEKDAYRDNLRAIVTRLRGNAPRPEIVLVNYYDLFDGCSANLPLLLSPYRGLSQATVEGNEIIAEVAKEKNCRPVSGIYGDFMHHCYGAELGDTDHQDPPFMRMPLTRFDIHPVTAGHKAIYGNVFRMLESLKSERTRAAASEWSLYE